MNRSRYDPCAVLLPSVIKENGSWRMWYGSCFKWEEAEDRALGSYYDIKYASSEDGIRWERDGNVCIGLKAGETNIGHPFVLMDNGLYRMWYSYDAGEGYRIGYAESPDGLIWTRMDDQGGMEPSGAGWDSRTVSHPCVFLHDGKRYMLYNGNDFGSDGFGLAVERQGT